MRRVCCDFRHLLVKKMPFWVTGPRPRSLMRLAQELILDTEGSGNAFVYSAGHEETLKRIVFMLALAIPPTALAVPARCAITIRQVTHEGNQVVHFRSRLRNAKECAILARFHEPNFSPEQVLAKKVSYRWLEKVPPPSTAKPIKAVAYRKRASP